MIEMKQIKFYIPDDRDLKTVSQEILASHDASTSG